MHGIHKSIMQTVTLPAAKTAEKASAVPDSFGLMWQKAMKADGVIAPRPNANANAVNCEPTVPKGQAMNNDSALVKGNIAAIQAPAAKSDTANDVARAKDGAKAATSDETTDKKTEVAADQDEEAATVDSNVQSEEHVPVLVQLSIKTLVADQMKKAGNVSAPTESKKQKAADTSVVVASAPDPKAPEDLVGDIANLIAVPIPAYVAQNFAIAVPKTEGKSIAKTDRAPAKKEQSLVAGGDAIGTVPVEAKSEISDAKVLPVVEAKIKSLEPTAVPVAAAHATTGGSSGVEADGGMTQGMIASVAMGMEHKATLQTAASSEFQNVPIAATGADVNAVHAVSVAPGQLEVGVLDGTHGWLKIRTEMGSDGSVTAMLTSSATAHVALKEAVPELAAYLVSESVNVGRIAVHPAAESSAAGGDLSNANGGSAARDGGTDTPYKSQYQGGGRGLNMQGAEATPQDVDSVVSGISAALFGTGSRFSGNGIGSWVSVTA
jgi:hypothetical protein